MKPVFTPLEQIESFLQSESGKRALAGLIRFIPEMEKEFERVKKAIRLALTEEAKQKYIDLENINSELRKHVYESGVLVSFDWENWLEGKEILEGIRPLPKNNKIKVCKLLTLIVKMDSNAYGYFDYQLRKGTILSLMNNLSE
jgi:hypothetical protein